MLQCLAAVRPEGGPQSEYVAYGLTLKRVRRSVLAGGWVHRKLFHRGPNPLSKALILDTRTLP
jgi:hypothetical protein